MSQTTKQIAGAQRRSLKAVLNEFNSNELYALAQKCKEVSCSLVAD